MRERIGFRAAGIEVAMGGLLLTFIGVVSVGSALAEGAKDPRIEGLSALIKAGKFAEAESGARTLLSEVEARSGVDSMEAAWALDMLVRSLNLGGKSREPETRNLAERAVAIKERRLGPDNPELGASLTNLGEMFRTGGDLAAARAPYVRALAIAEKTLQPDDLRLATGLNSLAILEFQAGDYTAARPLFERAMAIREKVLGADHPDLGPGLGNLATLLWRMGDYSGARPLFERALVIAERAHGSDQPPVADALNNLAILLHQTGDYAAARPGYERALAIREKALGPEHTRVAESLNNLGVMHYDICEYAAARLLYERALAIYEKTSGPDHPLTADTLNNLAAVFFDTGDFVAARTLYERALVIREKALGLEHAAVAASVDSLANIFRQTGDYVAARTLYERALAIREKALGPEHTEVAQSLNHLADTLTVMAEYAAARPLAERAVAIQETALGPGHPFVADSLGVLASLLSTTGDYAGARPLYERAHGIYEAALGPDNPYVARTLNDLASLSELAGDNAGARPLYERALAIRRRALGPDHPDVAMSLANLARLRASQGETAGAVECSIEAERISREHLRLTGRSLSERQALRYAAVRTSGLDLLLTLAVRGLDGVSRRGVLDALVRSRAVVLDEMAARHRAISGSADSDIANLASALAQARARLANLLVRGLGDKEPDIYRTLLDDARNESEQAERKLAGASAGFARELARTRLGLDEVAATLPPASALVAFAQYRRVDLRSNGAQTGRTIAPAKEASALGSAGTARDEPSYLAFVLRADEMDPQVVEIGSAREIDDLVERWKHEASTGALGEGISRVQAHADYRKAGAPLRKRIWDPLASALVDVGRVFVVPDGSLNLVNITALPAAGGGYLIESGPLVHYVSAERDLVPSAETRRGEGLLALGGPSYDATSLFASLRPGVSGTTGRDMALAAVSGSSSTRIYRGKRSACEDFASVRFEPLPATDKETRQIVRLWKRHGEDRPVIRSSSRGDARGEDVLDLRYAAASETALKRAAPGRRVLHLATHGFFLGGTCESALASARGIGGLGGQQPSATPSESPPQVSGENPLLLSGLVLAGANHRSAAREGEDDGIMTAEEIASLDLSGVEWAVLSACETGVGDVRSGEGVFGLRRSFQIAGVGTLIMSLWSVADESTRAWMNALYEARLVQKLDTAEAVRAASLAVMNQRRKAGESTHPFYWAAFVAAGSPAIARAR